MQEKLDEAKKTLLLVAYYMKKLKDEAKILSAKAISDRKVREFIEELPSVPNNTD